MDTQARSAAAVAAGNSDLDNLGLGLSNMTVAPAGNNGGVTADVYNSGGTRIGGVTCGYPGYYRCSNPLRNLAVGTYTIAVHPYDTRAQTFSVTLSLSHDVVGTLSMGTPTTIATSNPGQEATYTLSASQGHLITLSYAQISYSPSNSYVNVTVYDPSGAQTNLGSVSSTSPQTFTASTTGTYTLFFDVVDGGATAATASLQITPTSN